MPFGVELDGVPPTVEELGSALGGYGHFTAMQVRDGRVRGLDHHLRRLVTGTRLLFGTELDPDFVRACVRRLVVGEGALSVRVLISARALDKDEAMPTRVLVRTGPPHPPETAPLRLRSVRYQRVLPEVKHVGTFGLIHHSRQARLAGYDDALFVDHDGRVSEASIWNVGFLAGDTVVWPEAAVLPGTTMQVLREQLAALGVAQETREVRPAELPGFDAMFVTNSETPGRLVTSVDDVGLAADPRAAELLSKAYETASWDEI